MTESETEGVKENLSDSEGKFSEPDESKIDDYLVQIRELEDSLVKLESLPVFDPKYKKNRNFFDKKIGATKTSYLDKCHQALWENNYSQQKIK